MDLKIFLKFQIVLIFLLVFERTLVKGVVGQGLLKCPGPCMDPKLCRQMGGKILGYCINEKACCDNAHQHPQNAWGSCGTTLNMPKVSYFKSPNYPHPSRGDLLCRFELELSPSAVGIRIDFLDLKMDHLPSDPSIYLTSPYPICGSDMMFLKGFNNWSPDPRCGNLTGYSILVEREEGQSVMSIVFVMSSSEYKWDIRLTQIMDTEVNRLHELIYNKINSNTETNIYSPNPDKTYLSGYPRPYLPGLNSEVGSMMPMPPLPGLPLPLPIPPPLPYTFSKHNPSILEAGHQGPKVQEDFSNSEDIGSLIALPRILGGENSEANAIPWQVSIQSVEKAESGLCGEIRNMSVHVCGGSILDEKTVITAAHCFLSSSRYPHPTVNIHDLKVVVGDLDLCQSDEVTFTQEYPIASVLLHYNYISTEIINDLAIIQLAKRIEFNNGVQPIALADTDLDLSKITPLLSGWGSYGVEENATFPPVLQKTSNLVIMTSEECIQRQKSYLNLNLPESQLPWKYKGAFDKGICARGKTESVEAGYGDSGGPLVALVEDQISQNNNFSESDASVNEFQSSSSKPVAQLIGVVSHMRPDVDNSTNLSFHLDYFVKLSEFKKWILMGMLHN